MTRNPVRAVPGRIANQKTGRSYANEKEIIREEAIIRDAVPRRDPQPAVESRQPLQQHAQQLGAESSLDRWPHSADHRAQSINRRWRTAAVQPGRQPLG